MTRRTILICICFAVIATIVVTLASALFMIPYSDARTPFARINDDEPALICFRHKTMSVTRVSFVSPVYNVAIVSRAEYQPDFAPYWAPAPGDDAEAASAGTWRYHVAHGWPIRAFRCTVETVYANDNPNLNAAANSGRTGPQSDVRVKGGALYKRLTTNPNGGTFIASPTGSYGMAIPLIPIWPGLLLNVLFYSVACLIALKFVPTVRSVWRSRHGQCIKCGYSLAGLDAEKCPECGRESAGGGSLKRSGPQSVTAES